MSTTDISLSVLQATALASEISLAKNLATTSVNKVNNLTTEVNNLRSDVFNSLNTLDSKFKNLCNLLASADISGVSDVSFNYTNL
tara:strand:- start:1979 stop:2233 length:255 start_codon:yes stop_codon:yes gene_type:complete